MRVLTCNMGGSAARRADVRRLIAEAGPGVAFQEVPAEVAGLVPDGYAVAAGSVAVAARSAVTPAVTLGLSELGELGAGDPDPAVIVAEDFNTPAESRIYARHSGGCRNAFSAGGPGWGLTKHTRWFGVRLDHILTHRWGDCRRAWVGPDVGSDHRPLIADLVRAAE